MNMSYASESLYALKSMIAFLLLILIFKMQYIHTFSTSFHKDNECGKADESYTVEFYKKDDSLFMLFSERVAWFEADTICKFYEANLCVPNTTEKANFVAHFLSKSMYSNFEDFWIGGRKTNDQWMWLDGQLVINSNISILWSWDVGSSGKDCLGFERHKHRSPMLVEISCYLPKPFICERALSARTNKPLPTLPAQKIKIHDSIFTFYHSRLRWHEALAFCRTLGQRLAVVPNENVIKTLTSVMLRTRPNIENCWIGGYYDQNAWIWISTGEIIPTEEHDGYPPWHILTNKGCLLFDRHFTSSYFIPTSCERKRDFICEQYYLPELIRAHTNTIECIHNSTVMYINLVDKNWKEAKQACNDNGTILAETRDNETATAIAVCLGNHPSEPKHVWIGGFYNKDKWFWLYSNEEISNILPWYEDEFEEDSSCLNLDKADHDVPLIYGLQCTRKQPFVCQEKALRTMSTTERCSCESNYSSINVHYKNSTYVAPMFKIEPKHIFQYCQYFVGTPFTVNMATDVRKYVFDRIRGVIKYGSECCTHDKINLLVSDNFGNPCNLINLGTNHLSKDISSCEKKNYFLCQTSCSHNLQLATDKNAILNCKQEKTESSKFLLKTCKFSCGSRYSTFGPDKFNCDSLGWTISTLNDPKALFIFPECTKTNESAKMFMKVINEIKAEGFYFLIHERGEMNSYRWMSLLQFVASIIQVYPLSKEFPIGLLTFNNKVKIRIPFYATNSCNVLKLLTRLTRTNGKNQALYRLAFKKAQKEIKQHQSHRKNLIFLLTDKSNDGDEYKNIVKKLHEDNDIFVVGITGGDYILDLDLVASMGKTYRLHTMKVINYMELTEIGLDLLKFRSTELNCSDNLHTLPFLKSKQRSQKQFPQPNLDFVVYQGITHYILKDNLNHTRAQRQCRFKYGGQLIEASSALNLIKQTNLKLFHISLFWVDSDNQCSVFNISSEILEKIDCKLKQPYICTIDCTRTPPKRSKKHKDISVPSILTNCKKDEVLWGPSELFCNGSRGGWITKGGRPSPLPKCLSYRNWIKYLTRILDLKRQKKQAGIIFVIDESELSDYQFTVERKFAEVITKLYPASSSQPLGLITFGAISKVRIPYTMEDSCKFLESLNSVTQDPSSDNLNSKAKYKNVFIKINQEIAAFRSRAPTLIFLLTNGVFNGNILNVKRVWTNLLQNNNVEIFILKIGNFHSHLTSEVATRDYRYNLNVFNFYSYDSFNGMLNTLKKETDNKAKLVCSNDNP